MTTQPAETALTPALLDELAEWRAAPVVTSLYLDVDGRRHPRPSDYLPHLEHLFRVARSEAERLGETVAVESDLARIKEWLATGIDRTTVRGLALFSSSGTQSFRALGLPVAVRDEVSVAPAADTGQLAELLDTARRTLVVMVDHAVARVLTIELGRIEESARLTDEVPRQVDTSVELGSFERYRQEGVRRHLRRVARAVDAAARNRRRPVAQVILCGQADTVADLERLLSAGAARLVAAKLRLPMTAENREILAASIEVDREAELARSGRAGAAGHH